MTRRFCCLLAVAVLSAVSLDGRTPQADQTVFRSGVDLARLDVRITDASGRPITDLRQDEVSIVEDGVARPLLLFHHVAESGRSFLETVHQTVAAEISTNQGSPRGQLALFVFDQEHISPGNEQRARQAAETFLRRRVKPQDRVGVFGLPGPGPSLVFTANLRLALDELQHVRGDLTRTPTGGDNDMRVHEAYEVLRGNEEVLTRFLLAANGSMERTGVVPDVPVGRTTSDLPTMRRLVREHAQSIVTRADASARRFLEYTTELLKSFRDIDGRKTVLLFSEGFHNDNVTRELDRLAAAAAETYSIVYSFDLNRRLENLGATSVGADQEYTEISNRLDPLGGLALETGGRLFTDAGSHLDRVLDELGASETDYYVLGFSPSAAALADRDLYRRVSVRVSRPGAKVSTRTGYVAGQKPTPADRRRVIDKALAAPFSQQGLRLAYTTYVGQAEIAGMQKVVVSLEAELPVGTAAERFADVVFVARNASTGQIAASGSDRMALPERVEAGTSLGRAAWRVQFDLPAGTYLMRCVVREPGGLVGTADRHFSVRNLGGTEVAASDLVLGTPGEALPVRARAYSEQLLGGAVRVYGKSEQQLLSLSARLELISLDPATTESGTGPARTVVGEADRVVITDRGVRRDLSFAVPMSDLPAGEYIAKVTIRAGSEVVADVRRQVVLVAGAPPPMATATAARTPGTPREVLRGTVVARIVEKAAGSTDAAIQRAAGHARAGRWADVLQTLAAAPASDPETARLRGLARLDREEYAGAAAEFGREFTERPTDADLAFVLGWARVGAGDQPGAISAFRSAVFLDPMLVPGYLAAAEVYVRLGERALAAQTLEAGLGKIPNSPELSSMLLAIRK